MRFRYPNQTGKNILRLSPVLLLLVALPLASFTLYQYFTGAEENTMWVGFSVLLVVYFAFRAWMSLKLFVIFGDEEDSSVS